MSTALLTIDLDAVVANWKTLDALSAASCRTGAVIKADAYGLGVDRVARALAGAGADTFFVAVAEEGAAVRRALGPGPQVFVFSGHMDGDAEALRALDLVPLLNSVEQLARQFETMPDAPFGIQLDSGMNRLGLEPSDWRSVRDLVMPRRPALVMSHLACADDPDDPLNAGQLDVFRAMTGGLDAPLSLAATGGILLGPDYHFDLTRPGIGLYGGAPFDAARPVVRLSLPVIQVRAVEAGEIVGYGGAWRAGAPARIATVSGGYADGLIRAMGGRATLFAGTIPCPLAGRVSMDLLTADVSHLDAVPDRLDILCPAQGVDALAEAAGTIGYEILTALGARYHRRHTGAAG